jgi:YVTN family beta-propeller protein
MCEFFWMRLPPLPTTSRSELHARAHDTPSTNVADASAITSVVATVLVSVLASACSGKPPQKAIGSPDVNYSAAGALPTGRTLDPEGATRPIQALTLSMLTAPGHRFVLVQSGWGWQGIQVIDTLGVTRQSVEQRAAFVGAAFSPDSSSLYVSGGDRDMVYRYQWRDGTVTLADSIIIAPLDSAKAHGKSYPAGLAISRDGRWLYVAENLADKVAVVDLATKRVVQHVATGAYPYGVTVTRSGRVVVSIWSASQVLAFTPTSSGLSVSADRWATARHPSTMLQSHDGNRLFVTSGSTDRISVLDANTGALLTELRDPPPAGPDEGTTPSNLALSADGTRLFVSEADANAVAVFELSASTSGVSTAKGHDQLIGRSPTDWYPAALAVHGGHVLVANAKGHGTRANALDGPGPRASETHTGTAQRNGYTLAQLQGSITIAPIAFHDSTALAPLSARVARANRWLEPRSVALYPPIRHIIYVIKENRTYDQVFGDFTQADGDTSLMFFDRSVSPNHHALAERFGIYDRFLVNAEVSPDGHNWSTAAYTTDYLQRTVSSNYGGRGRQYDYEGTNRGAVPGGDLDDVNAPARGYLWDLAAAKGISMRNYGEFVVPEGGGRGQPPRRYVGNKPALRAITSDSFPGFNTNIPDQRRADVWISELRAFAKSGDMPQFQIVRLPNDHTAGASAGALTPKALFADNDLALGRMVEALSQTPFWSSTAIFVVEDDAQNGPDHVDSHRSPFLLISPWAKTGVVHRFANTTDIIRTMEEILGLESLSQFDYFGRPLRDVWRTTPDTSRYTAIVPTQSLTERNPRRTAAAELSRQLNFDAEDTQDETLFNRVLWMSIKGEHRPMPTPRRMSQLELIRAK